MVRNGRVVVDHPVARQLRSCNDRKEQLYFRQHPNLSRILDLVCRALIASYDFFGFFGVGLGLGAFWRRFGSIFDEGLRGISV